MIMACCCDSRSVRVSQMATKLINGRMLHYKKRLFGKDWRKVHVSLFNDSTLVWFEDKDQSEPDGGVVIKDAPELMAFGKFTSRIPNRPRLPHGHVEAELLAFGYRGREKVQWFLANNEEEVNCHRLLSRRRRHQRVHLQRKSSTRTSTTRRRHLILNQTTNPKPRPTRLCPTLPPEITIPLTTATSVLHNSNSRRNNQEPPTRWSWYSKIAITTPISPWA